MNKFIMAGKTMKIILLAVISIAFASCNSEISNESAICYKLPYNLSIEVEDDSLILIESQSEFNRLFGEASFDFEKIDFAKFNLIYVQGKSRNAISDISYCWHIEDDFSKLAIVIDNANYMSEYREWCLGFLVPKNEIKNVVLEVVCKHS